VVKSRRARYLKFFFEQVGKSRSAGLRITYSEAIWPFSATASTASCALWSLVAAALYTSHQLGFKQRLLNADFVLQPQ
jgi:hypothetical protein